MTTYLTPPADYWKRRDNSILLDVDTYEFRVHNRTRGKIRLFLGKFDGTEFSITCPTIKVLDEEAQDQVRKMVKFVILDFIKSFNESVA